MGDGVSTIWKTCGVFCLVICWTVWGGLMPARAELYRWQSEDGAIQYSNVPPADPSIVPERISVQKIPLVTDTDGTMYYLTIPQNGKPQDDEPPDSQAQQSLEPLNLPPDVLAQLAQVTSVEATTTPQPQGNELAPLIERLAELERIVQEEIAIREGGKTGERSDKDLKQTVTQMKGEIEKLQKAVAVTDIHLSTLKDPKLQFQAIERKVDTIQTNAEAIARRTEEHLNSLQETVKNLSSAQQESVAGQPQQIARLTGRVETIQGRTDELARQMERRFTNLQHTIENLALVQQQYEPQRQRKQFDERFTAIQTDVETLSQRMDRQLTNLRGTIEDMQEKVHAAETPVPAPGHSQLQTRFQELDEKMQQLYGRFLTIEERMNAIDIEDISQHLTRLSQEIAGDDDSEMRSDADTSILEERLDILSAKVQHLETQQTPDYNVRIKVATLETQMEDLLDSLPASRRASQVVSELREKSRALKTLSTYQGQQLQQQKTRIETLQQEFEGLKNQLGPQSATGDSQARMVTLSGAGNSQLLKEVREKNRFLEAVIKHQTNTLNKQKVRIEKLEAQFEQLLQALGAE